MKVNGNHHPSPLERSFPSPSTSGISVAGENSTIIFTRKLSTANSRSELILSDTASFLQSITEKMTALTYIDEQRINSLRQKIDDDNFSADVDRVAENMIASERIMINLQSGN